MENNWYAQFGCNLISEQSLDAREGYKKKKKNSHFSNIWEPDTILSSLKY